MSITEAILDTIRAHTGAAISLDRVEEKLQIRATWPDRVIEATDDDPYSAAVTLAAMLRFDLEE